MTYTIQGRKNNKRVIQSGSYAPACVAFNMQKKDIENYLSRYSGDTVHKIHLVK